jgi:hypothetical protein
VTHNHSEKMKIFAQYLKGVNSVKLPWTRSSSFTPFSSRTRYFRNGRKSERTAFLRMFLKGRATCWYRRGIGEEDGAAWSILGAFLMESCTITACRSGNAGGLLGGFCSGSVNYCVSGGFDDAISFDEGYRSAQKEASALQTQSNYHCRWPIGIDSSIPTITRICNPKRFIEGVSSMIRVSWQTKVAAKIVWKNRSRQNDHNLSEDRSRRSDDSVPINDSLTEPKLPETDKDRPAQYDAQVPGCVPFGFRNSNESFPSSEWRPSWWSSIKNLIHGS